MRLLRSLALLLLATAVPALAARAQARTSTDGDTFRWAGKVPAGRWLMVRNLNGGVRVTAATGDQAEVVAEKRSRRGDTDDVTFRVVTFGANKDNVLICALWDEDDECDEDGYESHGHHGRRRNDTSVEFEVKLPAGVKMDASTVNGSVDVTGARAEVSAHTVNGRVEATTSGGPVSAGTVNGDVYVTMGAIPSNEDLEFTTVNGSIVLTLPEQFDAEVSLSTVNGRFRTDYPVTVSGNLDPRRLRATIGKGGRRLKASTVNGSLELRKAKS
ncbi:MAG TPA: DUF4097 family beta strand repeat-containing protein [Gemmatimonadaceae bacterium]|nr:DUF4097 family beta strand repeat-containing protein [Gemmatimonadaceae bacterium]